MENLISTPLVKFNKLSERLKRDAIKYYCRHWEVDLPYEEAYSELESSNLLFNVTTGEAF